MMNPRLRVSPAPAPAAAGPPSHVVRMVPPFPHTNPRDGRVVWAPAKSLWFTAMAAVSVIFGPSTASVDAIALSFGATVVTLCLGHTIGFHRLLIHRSFVCSHILERVLVYLGTLVGMGGPFRVIAMHDIRDWAQRHPTCHPIFIDGRPMWRDALWQLHCEMRLTHPPEFRLEPDVAGDRFYQWLDRWWMAQQLPWAALFWGCGGWAWVVWGISVRITISLVGHWFIGYLAHNRGSQDWLVEGAAVQGFNLPGWGLLTMGEGWHNNHHAFPGSARLGLKGDQWDPGWWALCAMRRAGWVRGIRQPADLPARPELVRVTAAVGKAKRGAPHAPVPSSESGPMAA